MSDLEAILETGGAAAVEIAASAVAERGHQVHACANCSKPVIGAYCAICGQERDTHRRSVWGLIKVLIEDIASFDSRILQTGWALLVRPGELASAFREGRTQRYLPALRLYLFVSLIFFVILGATNIALMQLVVQATPTKITWINGQAYTPNPAYDKEDRDSQFLPKMVKMDNAKARKPGGHYEYSTKMYFFAPIGAYHVNLSAEARKRISEANIDIEVGERPKAIPANKVKLKSMDATKSWFEKHIFDGLQRLVNDPAALNGSLTTWIPRILFLLMPLYAMLLALFYIRQRKQFYFVDHLIFSLTIHAFAFVLLLVAAGVAQFLSGGTVGWILLTIAAVYGLIATRNFYHQNWFWTVVKFSSVSFFYFCFCVCPALAAVMILSFLNV